MPGTIEAILTAERAVTAVAGAFNAAFFLRYAVEGWGWRRRAVVRWGARRVAASVLALTNLALAAGVLMPGVAWRPGRGVEAGGLDALAGLLPAAAAAAMAALVLRAGGRSRR